MSAFECNISISIIQCGAELLYLPALPLRKQPCKAEQNYNQHVADVELILKGLWFAYGKQVYAKVKSEPGTSELIHAHSNTVYLRNKSKSPSA